MIRPATFSGSWYSNKPEELYNQLNEWLQQAKEESKYSHVNVQAIIAPHAGYQYSGSTAAHAYCHVDPNKIDRVFILGPSHRHYLKGCSLSTMKYHTTPFGNIKVDKETIENLLETKNFQLISDEVDKNEHSLELHLPFIKHVMRKKNFTIVPVLVGSMNEKLQKTYGKIFCKYLENPSNLFIISSDFCHWGKRFDYQPYDNEMYRIHEYIHYLDHKGIKNIENLDLDGFYSYLYHTKNTICGRYPIGILLNMLCQKYLKDKKGLNNKKELFLKFIKYAQSNECKNMNDSSVSYASAIIYSL